MKFYFIIIKKDFTSQKNISFNFFLHVSSSEVILIYFINQAEFLPTPALGSIVIVIYHI